MDILRAFRVALTALAANKLRSVLAVLGIVIGVSAVIMMIAMGKGAQAKIDESISKMGVNLIFIWPETQSMGASRARTQTAQSLTLQDADGIARLPNVADVAPEVRRNYQIKYMSRNVNAQVVGTLPSHLNVRNGRVERGVYFDKTDVRRRERVCVLGGRVARDLFGNIDPLNRTIQIDRKSFRVLGVLEDKGGDTPNQHDESVYVPVSTALYRLFNRRHLTQISVSADKTENIDAVVGILEREMRRLHRIHPNRPADVRVSSMNEARQRRQEASGAFAMLLSCIAGVSLFVGGIGIMNIMLVSVTERTREIGIRKAIGARRRDILKQFLIESTAISLLGGILGILLGIFGSKYVGKLPVWSQLSRGGAWEGVISPESVVVAFLFSCAVGIFFGLYPAVKASRLNPVEALRYE